jgi:hypothetical protein
LGQRTIYILSGISPNTWWARSGNHRERANGMPNPQDFYPVAQDKTGIFLQYTEPQHKRNRRALSLSYQPNGQDKNGLHEHLCSLMVIQEQEKEIWLGSGLAIGKSKTHAA